MTCLVLASGSVGRDFANQVSSKVDLLAQDSTRSKRVLVFLFMYHATARLNGPENTDMYLSIDQQVLTTVKGRYFDELRSY